VGLAGMTERIREIGGRLEVISSSTGTEIVARVPARGNAPLKDRPPATIGDGKESATRLKEVKR
jgi:hypothetical protein